LQPAQRCFLLTITIEPSHIAHYLRLVGNRESLINKGEYTMTFDDAKKLNYGDIIYHVSWTNADGSARRYKVNGVVKLWKSKKNALRIQVPLKHGLYEFGYLEQDANGYGNLEAFTLTENS
jgi:hypothetical protein